MRIQRIHLEHIGPFQTLDMEFKPTEPGMAEIHMLTGPNGSGKSTLLYALAAAFGKQNDAQALVLRRFRDLDGPPLLEIQLEGGECARFQRSSGSRDDIDSSSGQRLSLKYQTPAYALYCTESCPLIGYWWASERLQSKWRDPHARADCLAVAYSGERSLPDSASSWKPAEQEASLLESALSFQHKVRMEELIRWINATLIREALALVGGKHEEATGLRSTITLLEDILSALTGEQLKLHLESSPMELKVRWNDRLLALDVLPDGLKSVFAWLGDLLMRLDQVPWIDSRPLVEREVIVFLDEIDIHLHPAWQRQILVIMQKYFKRGQFFVSTHSPFIVGSVSNAWIHRLGIVGDRAEFPAVEPAMAGSSTQKVTDTVFGISSEFDVQTERTLDQFYDLRDALYRGEESALDALKEKARTLSNKGIEVRTIVGRELAQLIKRTGKEFRL